MKQSTNEKRTSQSFLEGALILSLATIIVKLIGALFKIPLGNLLQEEGFAYFNVAYNIFTPLYSLAMAGLPVAVARIVSENATLEKYRDVRKILRISTAAFTVTGGICSFIMILGARVYSSKIVETPAAFLSIICLAPAVFFCCMMSSRRGYYEGLKNMYPTAISQVIEAVVKLALGLLLSWIIIYVGTSQYQNGGVVFGTACDSEKEAMSIIYPFASAAAILGITLSTVFGAAYLHLRYRIKGDSITPQMLAAAPAASGGKEILRSIMAIAIPVSLGTLTTTLTSFIDSSSIVNRLKNVMEVDGQTIINMYSGITEAANDIPDFIYGAYCYAISIFNLVPSITTTFAISALPAVTAAWTLRDKEKTKQSIETVLRITSLVALPAGVGIAVMAKPILQILYPERTLGIEIAAPALTLLGIAVIFVALLAPINSMLQAVGRADIPVKLMLIGGAIKIVTNFVLVSVPEINVKGAPVGTLLCYVFLFLASMYFVCKQTELVPNIKATFVKPFAAAAVCGVAAFLSHRLFDTLIGGRIATVISIIFAALIYAICLLLFRVLTKDDINMLPKGKKFVKILEKYRLIG